MALGCYKVQLSASEPEAIEFYRAIGLQEMGLSMRKYFISLSSAPIQGLMMSCLRRRCG